MTCQDKSAVFQPLENTRLYLRNISKDDRDFIFQQFSDAVVNQYLFDAEPLTDLQGADEIIEEYTQPEPRTLHRWILVRKSDLRKIGTCGYHIWNCDDQTVEIGYDLNPSYWGHGYMREALDAIIEFAFDKMNIWKIQACISVENSRSIALVAKLGFQFHGETRIEVLHGNDYLHHIYSLVEDNAESN